MNAIVQLKPRINANGTAPKGDNQTRARHKDQEGDQPSLAQLLDLKFDCVEQQDQRESQRGDHLKDGVMGTDVDEAEAALSNGQAESEEHQRK